MLVCSLGIQEGSRGHDSRIEAKIGTSWYRSCVTTSSSRAASEHQRVTSTENLHATTQNLDFNPAAAKIVPACLALRPVCSPSTRLEHFDGSSTTLCTTQADLALRAHPILQTDDHRAYPGCLSSTLREAILPQRDSAEIVRDVNHPFCGAKFSESILGMILRAIGSALFLFSIVFTIPLAFDVGGRTCGLAFSLSLATYYFVLSCLRLAVPSQSTWRKAGVRLLSTLQILIIPTLLIWSLNKFSVDGPNDGPNWVTRAFFNATKPLQRSLSLKEWVFGREGLLENVVIGTWDKFLTYSAPVFQLTEGFCSLLLIQAAGQVTRYLVNTSDAGDGWMIGFLVLSGSVISSSVYFLWRISTFPGLDSQDAILIGIAITCAFFLCAWGIGSGRGNVIESSLLFAYVTLCIYQIFTDYQPNHPIPEAPTPDANDFPPLPPIFMASYSTILQALSTLPSALRSSLGFMLAAVQTVTPSVIISLTYRLMVLYAAARIIPAVRESGARALAEDPSLEDSASASDTLVGLISYFSPSILIAVYTSLLMQHFASASTDHPGEWWTSQGGEGGGNIIRWVNLAGTMALYAIELYMSKGIDDGMAGHWKLD